jgi:LacI family transcriptional regulator
MARRFDVAYTTMRQAVANLVDEGLLYRVRGKGTFLVEQSGAACRPSTRYPMALLFPADAQRRDPYYFPDVQHGFREVIDEGGHHTSLFPEEVWETPGIIEQGTAVAFMMLDTSHTQVVERLRDSGYRVLAINHYTGRRSIPSVWIDDASGVGKGVDHLAQMGHERIAFVAGPQTNLDAIDRLRGFREAVKRHSFRSAVEAGNGFNEASGYEAARQLLSSAHRPTGVVCASDLAAIGVISAARDMGISVPRGLSVVGFGDFSVARYVSPSLTTVQQCRVDLGRAAARGLIALAQGHEFTEEVLGAELIVRESSVARAFASFAE